MLTTLIVIIVGVSLIVGIFNVYMFLRISKSLYWILTHVKVVSRDFENDPELKKIKSMFGIEDKDPGK